MTTQTPELVLDVVSGPSPAEIIMNARNDRRSTFIVISRESGTRDIF